MSAATMRPRSVGRIGPRRLDPYDPFLLVLAVLAGLTAVMVITPLGSGDYGQWLMTARPYAGLSLPDYRAAGAVPPVVPIMLGGLLVVVGDPIVALRLFTVLSLWGLGGSAYFAGATLFRSRVAGLLATVLSLLVVEQFIDLFAFGGLLQANAIVFAFLAVASFYRAPRATHRAWAWWTAGAVCVGLAALTHVGSASILVPTGVAVALVSSRHGATGRWAGFARLVPLGVVLGATAAFWLMVLIPGSTDLVRNPASLDYRGPTRLFDSLTGSWPTVLVIVVGTAAILIGTGRELARRQDGPWLILALWSAITLGVLAVAVISGASTDYPRFATPILAPLVLAAGGALAALLGVPAGRVSSSHRRRVAGWSVAVLVIVIVVAAPLSADRFMTEANGYQLRDVASLGAAATWINDHLGPQATVLAPVREAKWIEGLTGRPALFSNAFRYSFRAEEWERSLAADTVLRSSGAVVNPFFFARLTALGTDQSAPHGLVIAANHGGEFLDLLSLAPDQTRILSPDPDAPILATQTNLAADGRAVTTTDDGLEVSTAWTGERRDAKVAFIQSVALQDGSSVLTLQAAVQTELPVAGLELELRPVGGVHVSSITITGQEATITFAPYGPGEPRLRVALVDGTGVLVRTAGDGLRIVTGDPSARLLITDLTGAGAPSSTVQWLDPVALVDQYDVQAVLLARDPTMDARIARMGSLGFSSIQDFGFYQLLVRP